MSNIETYRDCNDISQVKIQDQAAINLAWDKEKPQHIVIHLL